MIYFDSDMSKSTNTEVYFDWKTVIYIYVCGKCRTQFMLPMQRSVTFTNACVNEIITSIYRSFVYKAKEGHHVRINNNTGQKNATVNQRQRLQFTKTYQCCQIFDNNVCSNSQIAIQSLPSVSNSYSTGYYTFQDQDWYLLLIQLLQQSFQSLRYGQCCFS